MKRRIFSIYIVLGSLVFLAFVAMHSKAFAATPTASPTPTTVTFPQADFVATPLSGVAPLTVQFTPLYTSTTTPIGYCSWTFGDGATQSLSGSFSICPAVSHVYTTSGNFTVQLSVAITDMVFLVTKTNYIQLSGPAAPTPTLTPTTDPCTLAIYTVFGRVYDAANPSLSIANASVHAWTDINAEPMTTTAADGSYSLSPGTPYIGCHILGIVVFADGYQTATQAISWQDLKAQPQRDIALARSGTATRTPTATPTCPCFITTPTRTPTRLITATPSRTPTGPTPTRTRTPTAGPTATPTPGVGTCAITITAPFIYDGAGSFCWQSTNLGAYINSWNVTSLTVNGVNATNLYVAAASLPVKINGYWYVSYNSTAAYGHFETK